MIVVCHLLGRELILELMLEMLMQQQFRVALGVQKCSGAKFVFLAFHLLFFLFYFLSLDEVIIN